MAIALQRLKEERKNWRREKPFGFYARPVVDENGEAQLLEWEAGIPGKEGTNWEGGEYILRLEFSKDFPSKPPKVQFRPKIFHPNVYPSGTVCLSILNEEKGWKASITVKQILMAVQELLDNPNIKDPAQKEPYELYVKDKDAYEKRVREEAARFRKQFGDREMVRNDPARASPLADLLWTSNMVSTHPICAFDAASARFGIVHNNAVRVYDVKTGQLEKTLTPPRSMAHTVTCMAWGRYARGSGHIALVGIGCSNGAAYAWSLEDDEQIADVSLLQEVKSVAFDANGHMYAATASLLKVVDCTGAGGDERECVLPKNTTNAAVSADGGFLIAGAKKLTLCQVADGQRKLPILRRYTGHAGAVTSAAWVGVKAARFVTACDTESHVSLWDASDASVDTSTVKVPPVASLQLPHPACAVCAAGDVVIVLTKGETVHVWDVSAAVPGSVPNSSVAFTDGAESMMLGACLPAAATVEEVLVAKGSRAFPSFERVRVKSSGKKAAWVESVAIDPVAATNLLLAPAAKKRKAADVQRPMAAEAVDTTALDKTLDRRQSLGFRKEELLRRQGKHSAQDRVRITQALQQALARKDRKQIDVLLDEGIARGVVDASVSDLERVYALQLLRECVKRFQHKSSRAPTMLCWIRAVLEHHPQHLLSLPDLNKLLEPLQNVIDDHLKTYAQLSMLKGRLDVVAGRSRALKDSVVKERAQPLKVISEADFFEATGLLPDDMLGGVEGLDIDDDDLDMLGDDEDMLDEEAAGVPANGGKIAFASNGAAGLDADEGTTDEEDEEGLEEEAEEAEEV